jgi:hypothetical protein
MSAKHARLRAPMASMIIGTGIAGVAVAARGWLAAIPVEAIVIAGAIGYYVWGGRDSDTGAMIGSRPDERQRLLRMQAQAIAAQAMLITAMAGYLIAFALKDPVWPFTLFGGVGLVSFFTALAICRARQAP